MDFLQWLIAAYFMIAIISGVIAFFSDVFKRERASLLTCIAFGYLGISSYLQYMTSFSDSIGIILTSIKMAILLSLIIIAFILGTLKLFHLKEYNIYITTFVFAAMCVFITMFANFDLPQKAIGGLLVLMVPIFFSILPNWIYSKGEGPQKGYSIKIKRDILLFILIIFVEFLTVLLSPVFM